MPNRRKSLANHVMTGTYRPDRHARVPPHNAGVGAPPKHLDDSMQALWRELAKAVPAGIGSEHDRAAFELLVRLVARMRDSATNSADTAQLRQLLSAFALTPIGRQQLGVETESASCNHDRDKQESALEKYLR